MPGKPTDELSDHASTSTDGNTSHADTSVDKTRHSWLVQLGDVDVIAVTGPDSERFLQGQLSCNMATLSSTQTLRAALCNLKGRVVADLRVIMHQEEVLLLCRAGMADIVLSTLNKYKVFFKTELQKVTEQFVVLGLAGDDCVQTLDAVGLEPPASSDMCTLAHGAIVVRIEDTPARFYCLLNGANGELASALASRSETGSEQDWRVADICAGIAHIRPGQEGLYTPQVLNYDINGIIDFRKGCYTGQEVVARMHYRAEAKRRLRHVTLVNHQQMPEGAELVDSVQLADGQTQALVILPVSAE